MTGMTWGDLLRQLEVAKAEFLTREIEVFDWMNSSESFKIQPTMVLHKYFKSMERLYNKQSAEK